MKTRKNGFRLLSIVLAFMVNANALQAADTLGMDKWTYIHVDDDRGKWGDFDDPNWLKYFGLWMTDITGDGYRDIVSGRYFYRNPGGDMTGKWQRIDFGLNVDGMVFTDVDDDSFGDVIGTALPAVYWLEAKDRQGSAWKAKKIGEIPATGHVNGQGYALAQIRKGGKPEILLSSGEGIYYFEIPKNPETEKWPYVHITADASEEGIGAGDIDGDGDIDIAAGGGGKTKGEGMFVTWWENPGNGQGNWKSHAVGKTIFFADRVAVADINGDQKADVIVSEERYPGPDPNANLFWYEQPADPKNGEWKRHTIVTEYSLNNLDVADMDRDGDTDVITCEHKGPKEKLQIFENDGKGFFTMHILDEGKESHLGARVADMDGDGDLDIISIAWDEFKDLHLWRNDAIPSEK